MESRVKSKRKKETYEKNTEGMSPDRTIVSGCRQSGTSSEIVQMYKEWKPMVFLYVCQTRGCEEENIDEEIVKTYIGKGGMKCRGIFAAEFKRKLKSKLQGG